MKQKPNLPFWSLWNLSFGFFGVQIAYALQSGNISRIFRTLGADPHDLSFFWILPPLMLNRFSKDLENSIKYFNSFNYSLTLLFNSLSAVIISIIFYWKSIFIIPLIIFCQHYLYNYYKNCSKKLFILESYARLPILSGFSETLAGLSSIRCFEYSEKIQKGIPSKIA